MKDIRQFAVGKIEHTHELGSITLDMQFELTEHNVFLVIHEIVCKIVKQNIDICFTIAYTNSERSDNMAQAMINFRMDEELKKNMEQACKEMGLSMTAAFTIFATKVAREKRIPFEINADPFYSEENMERLRASITQMERGIVVNKKLEELKEFADE